MKKAFTLIELLVVIGIMGLLGTISVGGYRAMQRGMEERGVMQNVNSFIRAAYQRAQIDRQPTVICFWNETVRSSSDDKNEIVIGKAVALRRYGRFSAVRNNMLIDEFADLDLTYQAQSEDDDNADSSRETYMYIYPIEKLSDLQSGTSLRRTTVRGRVKATTEQLKFLVKDSGSSVDGEESAAEVTAYGFVIENAGGVSWKPGMAYGMEFMHLELPHNYLFGTQYSTSVEDPVRGAGTLVFDVGVWDGNGTMKGGTVGRNSISVCSLRSSNGDLKAEKVADSDNPEKDE